MLITSWQHPQAQLTLHGSPGHSALQGPGIQTHGTPALPSPASLPLQWWAVTINYALNRHPNQPGRLETACESKETVSQERWRWQGGGKEWKDKSAAKCMGRLRCLWWTVTFLADAANPGFQVMDAFLKAFTSTLGMQNSEMCGLYFKLPWERVKSSRGKISFQGFTLCYTEISWNNCFPTPWYSGLQWGEKIQIQSLKMVHTSLTLAPRGKIVRDSFLLHFLLSKSFYASVHRDNCEMVVCGAP